MSLTPKIVNGDVVISAATGNVSLLTGKSATEQLVDENLTIERLPNGWGAGVQSLVGTTPDNTALVGLLLEQNVRLSVDSWIRLQAASGVSYTADELIDSVQYCSVQQLSTGSYVYYVGMLTKSGATIQRTVT